MFKHLLTALPLAAALLLAGPAIVGPSQALAQSCLSQGEARSAVSSGQARPFSAYYGSLSQQGQVVSSCLIRSGGGYAYLVKLLQPNGQVISRTISAN